MSESADIDFRAHQFEADGISRGSLLESYPESFFAVVMNSPPPRRSRLETSI